MYGAWYTRDLTAYRTERISNTVTLRTCDIRSSKRTNRSTAIAQKTPTARRLSVRRTAPRVFPYAGGPGPTRMMQFEKWSVESTHKVPTSHYHTTRNTGPRGGRVARWTNTGEDVSRVRPPPVPATLYIFYRPPADSSRDRGPMPPKGKRTSYRGTLFVAEV